MDVRATGGDLTMGLFNPLLALGLLALLGGLLALAAVAARRPPGSDEAVLVSGVAAIVLGVFAAMAWGSDGATTWTVAAGAAALVATGMLAVAVYRRVRERAVSPPPAGRRRPPGPRR